MQPLSWTKSSTGIDMPILVDSGVLIAFLHRRDRRHHAGQEIMEPILRGEHGTPIVTDYVIDEVLTFLVAKGATRTQLDKAIAFVLSDGEEPGAFFLHRIEPDHFAEALQFVRRHRERRLSFTDCTCLAIMETLGIHTIASFDNGFDGLVTRLAGGQ